MKVYRSKKQRGKLLTVRYEQFFCADRDGVLVPQPDGRAAEYMAAHPSFSRVEINDERAIELNLLVQPEIVNPGPPISGEAPTLVVVPEPATTVAPEPDNYEELGWAELKAAARDRDISVSRKSKEKLIAELRALAE